MNDFQLRPVLVCEAGEMSAGAGVWVRGDGEDEEELRREATVLRDEAFAALVARQGRLMFRVAYSLLRNAQDAEDAVQEVLLKLYRGERWREMVDEKGFLARAVWRVGLDRLPVKGRRMEDVAGMGLAAAGASPEAEMMRLDERAQLRRLIEGLPEELRQALVLSAVEEMTSPEVAAVMGIPEGTVRGRVMRAKAELKRRYEAMGEVRR